MTPVTLGRCWIGRLAHGSDLLESLNALCRTHAIRLGRIEGLGAVQRACLGFYDQQSQQYTFLERNEELEITQLTGNVSLKDGMPFVHLHITLADRSGQAWGGHVAPGTILFAAEVIIQELVGAELQRGWDETTGLPLWNTP
ncbi:MAG: DNA-binding protein [Magnetococcales bacterium]|nr:DNA-binding protein [Magnetococcales bacterium]NGZ06658.1 DNA-binding protein [Magnetococcales bacterium]